MGKARAEIEITASTSNLARGLATAAGKFRDFSSAVARNVGSAFSAISKKMELGETSKKALGTFGGNMLSKGFDKVTEVAGEVRSFERDLTRLGMSMRASPAAVNQMRSSIRSASSDTGIAAEDILKASTTFYGLTNNAEETRKSLDTFARTAIATGADVDGLAKLAAQAQNSMKVDPSQFEALFSGLANQGKGAGELKDNLTEITTLLPRMAKMGGAGGKDGILDTAAALQVLRGTFGSSEDAAAALEAIVGKLPKQGWMLEAMGVKIKDVGKDGVVHYRSLHEIVKGIGNSKLAKNPALLAQVFKSPDAQIAIGALIKQNALYDEMIAKGHDAQTVQRDSAAYLESDSGRIDKAMNKLKESVAEAFTPERISAFVNAIEGLADKMEPLVSSVGKIGDVLGAVYHAGQSIRGMLNGNENGNEWRKTMFEDAGTISEWSNVDAGTSEGRGKIELAQRRLNAGNAYDSTLTGIMGGEVNERTSKESIKRAVIAAYQDPKYGGGSGLGASEAGRKYLDMAGVSPQEQQKIYGEAFKDALGPLPQQIAAAFKAFKDPPPEIHLGDNNVSKSVDRSTKPRTRPHP